MLIEGILLFGGYYLFVFISTYVYAVVKNWELTGVWEFKIKNNCIGVCKLPKWLLIDWVNKIVRHK